MLLTETNDRVHRLSRTDDEIAAGDCSSLRRVSGPVADELYFLCRPDLLCETEAVAVLPLPGLASQQ